MREGMWIGTVYSEKILEIPLVLLHRAGSGNHGLLMQEHAVEALSKNVP